ncbi:hypothetical protein FRB99_001211 [Tulasnella sp. 403]|nr:hypothetical protein FRB99_001211 [Tulasnella sp. 403]
MLSSDGQRRPTLLAFLFAMGDDPITPPSPTPSVVSFRMSVHGQQVQYRQVAGRIVNAQNDTYMLPADSEEQGRLNLQHEMLKLLLDSLYPASDLVEKAMLSQEGETPAICDVGTGSGIWAVEMAQQFPYAEVVGIDLAPPLLTAIPLNCRFEVDDVNLDLSHYTKAFNLVHMRSVTMGIRNFRETIHNVAQTLRPDGVLILVSGGGQCWTEHKQAFPVVNEGQPGWSATQAVFSTAKQLTARRGGDVGALEHWREWLDESPLFTNVGQEDIFIPIGPWIEDIDTRWIQITSLLQADTKRIIGGFKPLLVECGIDENTIDRWIALSRKEVDEMNPRFMARWRYVWATRTRTKWTPDAADAGNAGMADIAISIVLNVAISLQPAVVVLKLIYDEYILVETNREKLADLIERCKRVIGAINEVVENNPPPDLERCIKQLLRHLKFIQQLVSNLKQLSFMKALLRRDDIARQIEIAHKRLSDCLSIFHVQTAVGLRDYMGGMEAARVEDQKQLQRQLEVLQRNDFEVMKKFEALNNRVEAMMAMQKDLVKAVDHSVERDILKVVLASFQRSTRKKLPTNPPSWTITSFDVEIDTEARLGSGGFGTVKKGRWNGLVVAVKLMTRETDLKLLLKEIEVWNKLRHDHVLPFYGASITAVPPFIVSRFMANGNIVTYLRKNPNANRVKFAHEISLGMVYIHSQDIVHGDLKGLNVLVDDTGKACIADFGLSKIKGSATSQSSITFNKGGSFVITGTPRYMSPEAMVGTIDKKADVYAYSMTVYEIFTNQSPFFLVPDNFLFEVIHKNHTRLDRPQEPVVRNRGLNDGMWDLIMSASEPLPDDRPDFVNITRITERLCEDWEEVIQEGGLIFEVPESNDLVDLLDELHDEGTLDNPDFGQEPQDGVFTPTNRLSFPGFPVEGMDLLMLEDTPTASVSTVKLKPSKPWVPDITPKAVTFSAKEMPYPSTSTARPNAKQHQGIPQPRPFPKADSIFGVSPYVGGISGRAMDLRDPTTSMRVSPQLAPDQGVAARRRTIQNRIELGRASINNSAIGRRISSSAFIQEGHRSWQYFISGISSHLEALEKKLVDLQPGTRVIQADLPGMWAQRVASLYPRFHAFALSLSEDDGPRTTITPNVERLSEKDDRLEEPFDVSLWMSSAVMDKRAYEANASLLRAGGLILGVITRAGGAPLVTHPAFETMASWTADSKTREGNSTQGIYNLP